MTDQARERARQIVIRFQDWLNDPLSSHAEQKLEDLIAAALAAPPEPTRLEIAKALESVACWCGKTRVQHTHADTHQYASPGTLAVADAMLALFRGARGERG